MKAYRVFALAVIPLLLFAHISYAQGMSSSTVLQARETQDTAVKTKLKLDRSLRRGMTGSDVKALQEYLVLIPNIGTVVNVSGYFGSATEIAVKKFQEREGIANSKNPDSGYGLAGPRTVARINEVLKRAANPNKESAGAETASTTKIISATTTKTALANSTSSPQATTTSTASAASSTAIAKVAPLPDTTPPLRSNGFPSGIITGTSSVSISLNTNEPANCFWSNTPNTPFNEITASFTSTGWFKHSFTFWSVSQGDYSFYVKCRDRTLNANKSDYPIIFSLPYRVSGRDPTPPRVFMSFPIDNNVLTEGPISLLAVADDNSDVAGVNFFLNSEDLNAEDTKPPYSVTLLLSPGAYSAFAVARDSDGNHATSTTVKFSVISKPDSSKVATAFSTQSASAAIAFRGMFEKLFLALFFGNL